MSSLEKCLLRSSAHFLIKFFFFLMLNCMSSLYILDPLLNTLSANIFSNSVGGLFVLLIVSFAVQKLCSLMWSHLFSFACFPCLRRHIQKKLLRPILKRVLPMFSSRSFMVSGLTFKSLIHFGSLVIFLN